MSHADFASTSGNGEGARTVPPFRRVRGNGRPAACSAKGHFGEARVGAVEDDAPPAEAVIRARIHFGDQPYLLLLNKPMKNAEQFGYRLLYSNLDKPFEKDDEMYWLYATPGVTQ